MRGRGRGLVIASLMVLAITALGAAGFLAVGSLLGRANGSIHHQASLRAKTARTGRPKTAQTGGAPSSAIAAIQRLTSASTPAEHQVLTPELDSLLPPGRLFPRGTTFSPSPHGWHQSGAYANITGTIRSPGRSAVTAEIGLVLRQGHWLVTFEEQQ